MLSGHFSVVSERADFRGEAVKIICALVGSVVIETLRASLGRKAEGMSSERMKRHFEELLRADPEGKA